MIELTHVYGFITVGLLIGLITGSTIKNEGVSFNANLFWGVVSGIINGYIGLWFLPGDGVFFAFQGTWAFLFIINAFHYHHVEDVLLYPDTNAAIISEITFKHSESK
jgi:hypothetical protein